MPKPELLDLKAEVDGAGTGAVVPATLRHTGRPGVGQEGAGAGSPLQAHAGDTSLQPAGQGSLGNTLRGQGPENASCSTWGTPLQGPNLETGTNSRIHHSTVPANHLGSTVSSAALKSMFLVCNKGTRTPDS